MVDGVEVPAAGSWIIDPAHTCVGFCVRHLTRFPVRGRFRSVSGLVEVAENPAASRVDATIAMASISSGAGGHDDRLRSSEHLDVERHPTAVFRSTQVRWRGRHARVRGELTILEVTNVVDFAVRYRGTVVDPWGVERSGFSAVGVIDREDWGLTWNVTLEDGGLLVSRRIRVDIDLEAVRRSGPPGPAPT